MTAPPVSGLLLVEGGCDLGHSHTSEIVVRAEKSSSRHVILHHACMGRAALDVAQQKPDIRVVTASPYLLLHSLHLPLACITQHEAAPTKAEEPLAKDRPCFFRGPTGCLAYSGSFPCFRSLMTFVTICPMLDIQHR